MKQFDTWKCFCVFYTELIKLIFVLVQKHPWPIRHFSQFRAFVKTNVEKKHIFNISGKHKEIYRDRKTCIYFLLRGLCDSRIWLVTKYSLSRNCFEGLRVVCDFFLDRKLIIALGTACKICAAQYFFRNLKKKPH